MRQFLPNDNGYILLDINNYLSLVHYLFLVHYILEKHISILIKYYIAQNILLKYNLYKITVR